MTANFKLKFDYEISYKQKDLIYFGINLLLGCREFPLRLKSGDDGSGKDISPLSTGTFNFSSDELDVTQSSVFDTNGLEIVEREMLYSSSSQSNKYTFRMGSVALRLVVGFNPGGNINDLFDDQFIKISDLTCSVTIDGDGTTQLVAKPSEIKLGKQHGEILILSFENFT
jgi:hypothetical protein